MTFRVKGMLHNAIYKLMRAGNDRFSLWFENLHDWIETRPKNLHDWIDLSGKPAKDSASAPRCYPIG